MSERKYTVKQIRFYRAIFQAAAPAYDVLTLGWFSKRFGPLFETPITQRLQKIDEAKAALGEALEAIEDLQAEAETNGRALKQLHAALEEAEQKKTLVVSEVEALKEMADIDAAAVSRALKLPTTASFWKGHAISFGLGLLASLVASWLWSIKPF